MSKLRLSEAIALGRTQLNQTFGSFYGVPNPDGTPRSGCALGMANFAVTVRRRSWGALLARPSIIARQLKRQWPWLTSLIPLPPCGCTFPASCEAIQSIAHLNDIHVRPAGYGGYGDWTMEQLIDWVRSVEPAPEPEQENTLPNTKELHASESQVSLCLTSPEAVVK